MGRRGGDGALAVRIGEPVSAAGVPVSYYRFLRQFSGATDASGDSHRAGLGRAVVPAHRGRRAAVSGVSAKPDLAGQPVPPAGSEDESVLARVDSRTLAMRHLHCLPDRVLHGGVPFRSLVAGRRSLQRPAQHALSLGLCAVRWIPAGRIGRIHVSDVRHSVPEKACAIPSGSGSPGGIHMGFRTRGISTAAVLHSRRGSGDRRGGLRSGHAAVGNPPHAGVALFGRRHV